MANLLARDNPFTIILAPILWSLHFLVVYCTNAVACAKGWSGVTVLGLGLVDFTVLAATVVVLVLLAGLAWLAWGRFAPVKDARDYVHEHDPELARQARQRFMALAGLLQCGLAFVATGFVALPVLLVPKC